MWSVVVAALLLLAAFGMRSILTGCIHEQSRRLRLDHSYARVCVADPGILLQI